VVKNISSVWAHNLGAVNIAIGGIALAGTSLSLVPVSVGKGLGILVESLGVVVIPCGSKVGVLDVLAGSVARAVVRAGRAAATLTAVTLEALALTSGAVADTLVTALSIGVSRGGGAEGGGRSSHPGEGVGAHTLGAVSTLPVSEAGATIRLTAVTVTTAQVGASGSGEAEGGKTNSS